MEANNQNQPDETNRLMADDSLESLEDNGPTGSPNDSSQMATPPTASGTANTPLDPSSLPSGNGPKKDPLIKRLLSHSNIYLLAFVGLLLLAGIVVVAAIVISHGKATDNIQTQAVTKQTLEQLANSDVSVGQPKQILNVQSNAVFAGQVLIKSDLDVAGKLQVGNGLSLPDVTVSGTTLLAETQVQKDLSVAGNTTLQGQLNIQNSLAVAGGATFGGVVSAGQLNVNNLQLTGDLALNHHIVTNGSTPGRSGGSALGSGGSASVSGSDTAGTINVNTGGGASAGCYVNISFTQKYNTTPHVLVSPIGSAAASSGYYLNRSSTGFSLCANTPPSGASFAFDYFVID